MSNSKYALVHENGDLVVTARDTTDFFTPTESFWLTGCSTVPGRQLGNVELRVLDSSGHPMGAYFVGAATVDNSRPHSPDHALVDIHVHGLLADRPHSLAGAIWDQWHHSLPAVAGEWHALSPPAREAWLEVVRLHHRWAPHAPHATVVRLPSDLIEDPADFYCALGEAVNGPGGYFGANLDALADCLRDVDPFTLLWHPAPNPQLAAIIGVLTDAGVTIAA